MNADEVTKQDVDEMDDDMVRYWFNKFSQDEQASQMRKHMLAEIEVREASEPRVIKIDSTVVE